MPTYKTPDVYVEELSVFPPSVAEVETAIPAFIGYTEKAKKTADSDLVLQPTEIYSLKEYENYYGGPQTDALEITVADDPTAPAGFTASAFKVNGAPNDPVPSYLLYYAVKMFFDNGGGKCYIVSVGIYQAAAAIGLAGDGGADLKTKYGLQDGLDAVALEDEPTMLVIPEAVNLTQANDYETLVRAMLLQCGGPAPQGLHDRFAIFDIYDGDKDLDAAALTTNRGYFGTNYLSYGAAYYPFLKTAMNYYVKVDETNVAVTYPYYNFAVRVATAAALPNNASAGGVLTAAANGALGNIDGVAVALGDRILVKDPANRKSNGIYTVTDLGVDDPGGKPWTLTRTTDDLNSGTRIGITEGTVAKNTIMALTTSDPITLDTTALTFGAAPGPATSPLANFKATNTAVYNFVKTALKDHYVKAPPSGAVAGVYAATDTNRGVWKAPANVSLADVVEPLSRLDNAHQDNFNVDVTSGKSINALREFAGKGTLVWGARTLDGNSNEWRYVPVRRFFIMVEESVKKSTYWAVFETNDANTWVKVRGMIENYLTQKWREGALAGATTKEAFFVKCGLGTTMTAQDILEGRMNVEIGMAVVRPAEFIILKFSHKLQTS
jgi:phage tail sheath protein FI